MKYLDDTGLSHFWDKLKAKFELKSNLKANAYTDTTDQLARPTQLHGLNDPTLQTLVCNTRADRLIFLPTDQVIIEKTTDGGTTWVDAGVTDDQKRNLFAEQQSGVAIPLLNGVKNINCGVRITITAMKYNVPSGTTETQKYNYWNSTYVSSRERYCQLKEMYFWVNANSDGIGLKIERATGANSTTWSTIYDSGSSFALTGWSGCDYVRFSQGTFGGGTNQTGNCWNYRLTFMTRGSNGGTTLSTSSTTQAQSISEIRGYGDSCWNAATAMMWKDHLYGWDKDKNATFPAKVTSQSITTNGITGTSVNATSMEITGNIVSLDTTGRQAFTVGSSNKDTTVLRIYSSDSGTATTGKGQYGYSLKYLGTGSGANNKLQLLADNSTSSTQKSVVTITNDGKMNIDQDVTTSGTINTYTLNNACAKDVDTSISAASTSTKLPTSQAVASFVEGKGYGTSNLTLGETSSTAYYGDKGKTAYDHSQVNSGNPHNVTASDVGLGNVGNFKAVSTVASQGLTSTEKSNARTNIGAGTSSLSLGTGSSNAYRGDYGNTAYSHATDSSRLTTATASGLYKVASTAEGHIAGLTAVEKADITALGIPAQDTTYFLASPLNEGLVTALPDDGNGTIPYYYLNGNNQWNAPVTAETITNSSSTTMTTITIDGKEKTKIVIGKKDVSSLSMSNSVATGLYRSNTIDFGNYPSDFSGTPEVSFCINSWSAGPDVLWVAQHKTYGGNGQHPPRLILCGNANTAVTGTVGYIAIGKQGT